MGARLVAWNRSRSASATLGFRRSRSASATLGFRRSRSASAALGASFLAVAGCGEQCFIFPTSVELAADPQFVEAPGEVLATATTVLGTAACGPEPTEVTAYHWRLDGEPLEGEDGGP